MKPAALKLLNYSRFLKTSGILFLVIFFLFGLHFKNESGKDLFFINPTSLKFQSPSTLTEASQILSKSPKTKTQSPKLTPGIQNNFRFPQKIWFAFGFLMVLFVASNAFLLQSLRKTKNTVRQLNQRMDILSHELGETNLELDTFLYKASHDLKGPISTLDGLCNIGLVDGKDLPVEQYFQLQKEVIHKMQLLLFRLVEIGDIRNHQFCPARIKLRRFCRSIVRSMHRVEGFDKIHFHIDVPDELEVYTDVEMLEIVVDNIVKNAIQHANYSNEQNAQVSICADSRAQELELYVADNGMGIPLRIRGRIFEMFFRGNNYLQGFGLGLYKSKVAAKKISGEVKLLKSDEKGSTFSVVLPYLNRVA